MLYIFSLFFIRKTGGKDTAFGTSALKKLKIIKGKIIVNQNNLEFKNKKFKERSLYNVTILYKEEIDEKKNRMCRGIS